MNNVLLRELTGVNELLHTIKIGIKAIDLSPLPDRWNSSIRVRIDSTRAIGTM
jgi:hypothetical protein